MTEEMKTELWILVGESEFLYKRLLKEIVEYAETHPCSLEDSYRRTTGFYRQSYASITPLQLLQLVTVVQHLDRKLNVYIFLTILFMLLLALSR